MSSPAAELHADVMRVIESLMPSDPAADSAEGKILSALAEAIEKYEKAARPEVGALKLDTERQVFFYEQDHYYLSNFSAFKVEFDGYTFDTAEHAYHFQRFPQPIPGHNGSNRHAILFASSAHEAFRFAQDHKASQRPDWDEEKVGVMRRILEAKVAQHEYVRRKLLQTGNRELIENSWRDPFWGWGPNRDGKNMLGRLWMAIRSDLAAGHLSPFSPLAAPKADPWKALPLPPQQPVAGDPVFGQCVNCQRYMRGQPCVHSDCPLKG